VSRRRYLKEGAGGKVNAGEHVAMRASFQPVGITLLEMTCRGWVGGGMDGSYALTRGGNNDRRLLSVDRGRREGGSCNNRNHDGCRLRRKMAWV
jgi:hypothetical protein